MSGNSGSHSIAFTSLFWMDEQVRLFGSGVREMFWFKGCPKCHGDLYSDKDVYGSYIVCFQCSHYLTREEESRLGSLGAQLEHAEPVSLWLQRLAV